MCAARLVLSALFLMSFAFPALGAPQAETPPRPTGRSMRIVTDGAKNPERIPDTVAISMFITAIAIPADADKRAIQSMQNKIAPMGLNRSDVGILRGEMSGLHARLAAQPDPFAEARARGDRGVPKSEAVAAQNTRDALAMDSYTRLLETLSPEGRKKLAAHITKVKTQIKGLGRAQ